MKKLPIAVAVVTLLGVPAVMATGIERGPVFDGELSTWTYPESTKTRAGIIAERDEAFRHGRHLHNGELTVWKYAPGTLSRARVAAEAREAQRLGFFNDLDANHIPSDEQLRQVHAAGLRAEGGAGTDASGDGR